MVSPVDILSNVHIIYRKTTASLSNKKFKEHYYKVFRSFAKKIQAKK